MTKIGMFDSGITSHADLVDAVQEVLEDEGSWVETPDLASKIHKRNKVDMTENYIRSLLTYVRQYMLDRDMIETKSEREGGEKTIYWKVVE